MFAITLCLLYKATIQFVKDLYSLIPSILLKGCGAKAIHSTGLLAGRTVPKNKNSVYKKVTKNKLTLLPIRASFAQTASSFEKINEGSSFFQNASISLFMKIRWLDEEI